MIFELHVKSDGSTPGKVVTDGWKDELTDGEAVNPCCCKLLMNDKYNMDQFYICTLIHRTFTTYFEKSRNNYQK